MAHELLGGRIADAINLMVSRLHVRLSDRRERILQMRQGASAA
jgi:hypothetical protein